MDGVSQRMVKRERKASNCKQSPYSSKHVRLQQAVVERKFKATKTALFSQHIQVAN
jgi:hypothetical protein